jgi:hypothetical protein
MLKTVLVALAMAASSAMAAESDEDYKAAAAIRECASVVRLRATPGSMLFMIGAIKLFRPTFSQATKKKQMLSSKYGVAR